MSSNLQRTLQAKRTYPIDMHAVHIMGILNITPDSFYPASRLQHLDQVLLHAQDMVKAGATILDIGGESTRPGAVSVPIEEECDRVLPVLEALRKEFDVLISVDTQKTEVMKAAIALGANLINDVNALQAAGAIDLLASYDHVSICLMHKKGLPSTMQDKPFYDNVISEVRRFLEARIDACYKKGIDRSRLIVDPGIGFGKRLEDNMRCLKDLQEFKQLLCPILVGVSRKSMFDQLLGLPVSKRLLPSVVTAFYALQQGANIIRVHDVRETHQALKLCQALC